MKKSLARQLAKEQGEITYVPEKPCMRGHSLRKVSSGDCVECKRQASRLCIEANREAYNLRKRKERQHRLKQIAEKAKETRKLESLEKRTMRLEKAKINARIWREKNKGNQSVKDAKKKYKLNNPDKQAFHVAKRRALFLKRVPSWLTSDDLWMIKEAYNLAKLRTKLFDFQWHVDHIIPLQGKTVSGLHVPTNLRVVTWKENVSKANKFYLPR